MVVDNLVVEHDVWTIGRNYTHYGFIAQIVLSSHDEVNFGRWHLRDKLDGLRVASGFGYCKDLPTPFSVFFHKADHTAFGSSDGDFTETSDDDFGMHDIHFLRHLCVNAQESITVSSEHGIGDVLVIGVVGP